MKNLLLTGLKIKDIEFKNRLVLSPMCQYSAINGFATDWHFVHYGARAAGGVSLTIQEATAVLPEGRITPGDLGLWDDLHIEKLKKITEFIRSQNCIPGIQLAHAGRKASCDLPWKGGQQLEYSQGGWSTVSSSAIPFNSTDRLPEPLDVKGMERIKNGFRQSARRAFEAGYQVAEIHAAHGYLLHQFLSPLCNHRNDEYGGTFENRIRLLVETVAEVKKEWPENLPLFVRISATDWADGGWCIEEAVQLAEILKKTGVDLIDCSSGGTVPWAKIPFEPGYQVQFSEKIKTMTGIMTGAVGLITLPEQVSDIVNNKKADLVLIGRQLLREPNFVLRAATELKEDTEWPVQYIRAR
jgi:2,4-dienoyl-CoA reductase-like NADH-dependent reductase (Old Yellow Enzyme family)